MGNGVHLKVRKLQREIMLAFCAWLWYLSSIRSADDEEYARERAPCVRDQGYSKILAPENRRKGGKGVVFKMNQGPRRT